jgi:hypothetical protein
MRVVETIDGEDLRSYGSSEQPNGAEEAKIFDGELDMEG